MFKAIVRILHFLIYLYLYLSKRFSARVTRIRQSLRYQALWLMNGLSDHGILQWMSSRMTKRAHHAAIIVNDSAQSHGQQLLPRQLLENKVAEIITWMMNTGTKQVTVIDQEGRLADAQKGIIREIQTRIEAEYLNGEKKPQVVINDTNKENNVVEITVKQLNSSKSGDQSIRLKFLNSKKNLDDVLSAIESRAVEIQKKQSSQSSPMIIKSSYEKKDKQAEISNYLSKNLECYQGLMNDDKDVPINPQMALVFNSRRRILELPGFPMLMKEIVEIFESGDLQNYRCIDFVSSLQRYSSIEQRWGI